MTTMESFLLENGLHPSNPIFFNNSGRYKFFNNNLLYPLMDNSLNLILCILSSKIGSISISASLYEKMNKGFA